MTSAPRAFRAATVLTLVAALLGLGTASAAQATADPHAGAPAVGACYDATLRQAFGHAVDESTVPCTARHTLVVTAVGTVPASVDLATIDWTGKIPRALASAITRTCDPATAKVVGTPRARALTLYQDYVFAPTSADIRGGARWFSCTVGLTEATRLLPIPAGQPTKVTSSIPRGIARCARTSRTGYPTVACSRPHQWRTTFAAPVHAKLTEKRLVAAANRICPRHVSSRRWLYFADWVSPTTFIVGCSTKTRH